MSESRSHGKTIAEKILSAKSGADSRAGDTVVCGPAPNSREHGEFLV